MRIAFLTPEYVSEKNFDGGLANYLYRVSKALKCQGHNVEIFTYSDVNQMIIHDGIIVHRIYTNRLVTWLLRKIISNRICNVSEFILKSYFLYRRFLVEHYKEKFDIVQAASYKFPGLFVARSKKVPVVTRISSFEPFWRAACGISCSIDHILSEWLEITQMKHSNAVYAPSGLLSSIVSKYEPIKIDVIQPPFRFPQNLEWDEGVYRKKLAGKDYLLFFGTICRMKGVDFIWKNLPRMFKENDDIEFVFVGKGCLPDYFDDLNLYKRRIHKFESLQHTQLLPIVKNARAIVLPSIIDNLPNACLESMYLKKVVVATKNASFDEVIDDEVSGYLVDYNNDDEFCSLISRVCNAPSEELDMIGNNACNSIKEKLDWNNQIDQLIQYYRRNIKQ
ncbi:spore coat protein SA [Sporomusaceae bacterium FL31]|nr:spore coat protein SA [Sporomusaceae bacterium FL31]GCE33906.1 spore coat protein SA [Sporomusaceae bacterium]